MCSPMSHVDGSPTARRKAIGKGPLVKRTFFLVLLLASLNKLLRALRLQSLTTPELTCKKSRMHAD
jgi:hypothetical protein